MYHKRTIPIKSKDTSFLSLGPSSYFDYGHTDCRYCSAIAKRCNEEKKKAAGKNIKNSVFILPFDDVVGQCDIFKDLTTSFYKSIYQDNRFRGTLDSINKSDTPMNGLELLVTKPTRLNPCFRRVSCKTP